MKSHGKSKAVLAAVIFEVNLLQSSRFGEGLRIATDNLNSKNFYACNPSFDKGCGKNQGGDLKPGCGCSNQRMR